MMDEREELQALRRLAELEAKAGSPSGPAKWSDLPGNILPSAGRFAGNLAQAVMHPVDTLSGAFDAAAGGLRNLAPAGLRRAVDSVDTPEAQQAGVRASATADAVGQQLKQRYGNLGAARETLITDPVGAAADLSTVFAGGAGLAGKAGMAGTSNALLGASKITNPLSVVAPVARGVGNVAGKAATTTLGLSTGAGAEAITQAAKAGAQVRPEFLKNLSGEAPMMDLLTKAKLGLENMGRQKAAEYRANMAAVTSDKTTLSFAGIDKALSDAAGMVTFKGQVKNASAASAVQKMADDVAQWKRLRADEFHTPEGLDALKQKLGGTLESIPFEEKTARLAAGKIYNAVKDEITTQAPTYAKTMKSYSEASEAISEIERALSLGKKASADTALRKLQSLMRNNASTNYGHRLDLARTLEDAGGVDLMPALAGQALNSWAPRSLTGQGAGLATLGVSAAGNPGLLGLLPFQSPRTVGLAAYGAGRIGGVGSRLGDLAGINAGRASLAGLTAAQIAALQKEEARQ
jgi:hypothetical protein